MMVEKVLKRFEEEVKTLVDSAMTVMLVDFSLCSLSLSVSLSDRNIKNLFVLRGRSSESGRSRTFARTPHLLTLGCLWTVPALLL